MEDSVATGRKPVVAGRAVHGSSSSLVGYRRTNEGYCSLLYSTIHTRTGARTSTELLGWLQPSPLFDWLPLHPCPPSFCSRGTERKRGGLVSSPTVARIPFPFVKRRPFCSSLGRSNGGGPHLAKSSCGNVVRLLYARKEASKRLLRGSFLDL